MIGIALRKALRQHTSMDAKMLGEIAFVKVTQLHGDRDYAKFARRNVFAGFSNSQIHTISSWAHPVELLKLTLKTASDHTDQFYQSVDRCDPSKDTCMYDIAAAISSARQGPRCYSPSEQVFRMGFLLR
jgi:hypothetical protein